MPITDNEITPIQHDSYYGLVLGKNECKLPKEFASTAIDVELSYNDIRPINCPKKKCSDVTGDRLTYVGTDCCKSDFWYVDTANETWAVDNGSFSVGKNPCALKPYVCPPPPAPPKLIDFTKCDCDEKFVIRLANVDEDGRIGQVGVPSNVGGKTDLSFDKKMAVYVSVNGSEFMYQGVFTSYNFNSLKLGAKPIENYCECPTDVKFLVKHKDGALITLGKDRKRIHISHPYHHHLWGKYDYQHSREIISIREINGTIFVFDGEYGYVLQRGASGDYYLDKFNDEICIKSDNQLAVYEGSLFAMTRDGIRSITGSQYNRSVFGLINTELLNPAHIRCMDDNWRIGVYNGRIHFANDDKAYIYNLTVESKYALTESSLVPDSYHTTCNGIYYKVGKDVFEWNPCNGKKCKYKYCTGIANTRGCRNIGAMRLYGQGNGGSKVSVSYYGNCMDSKIVCEKDVCLCETITITGCTNAHGIKLCFEGYDIMCSHELATANMELR